MSPERNLLFGLLALQNGFINRDQLVTAFGLWTADKSQSLDQIFRSQGVLDQSRIDLLLALTTAHLAQHADDPQQSLAALSSVDDARLALTHIQDAELQHSLRSLPTYVPSAPSIPPNPYATAPHRSTMDDLPPNRRFRVLRPHARGGLGEVFVAVDTELHREVALKEIQPRFAGDQANRARFVREAEITGGLEHPSIVPVYGLGAYADGRPFYAMKFIRGDSLKEAIEAYHKPGGTASEKSLQLRQLLQRFIDICEAMQYAHDRGVLHRDLKPGNIMLGRYGETLVVDWGLAKPLGKNEETSPEATLIPASSGSGETLPGSAVGTPAYMSPEQAAGRLEELGPASDIYSLGATLYHVLTGEAPFKGRAEEVMQQVIDGKLRRPRLRSSAIPRSLEAICLKAMALNPQDRYATAKELAAEVEHWLADEPVTAIRESAMAKASRISRKHRGVMTAVLVASILFTLSGSGVAVFMETQRRENVRLAAANDALVQQAEREQSIAELEQVQAIEAKRHAQEAEEKSVKQREIALVAEKAALAERNAADAARDAAIKAKDEATISRRKAEEALNQAKEARMATEVAQKELEQQYAELEAANETIQAQREISLYARDLAEVSSLIANGNVPLAQRILFEVERHQRGWEWALLAKQACLDEIVAPIDDDSGRPRVIPFRTPRSPPTRRYRQISTGESAVTAIAISGDSSSMATAGGAGLIQLWDTSDWSPNRQFKGHTQEVHALA